MPRIHVERGGFVAVNLHRDLRVRDLQVAVDINKAFQLAEFLLEDWRKMVEFRGVGTLERELVLAFGELSPNADRRRHLQVGADAGNLRDLGPDLVNDFVYVRALAGIDQPREDSASIQAGVHASAADGGRIRRNIWIFADGFGDDLLVLDHVFERDALLALSERENLALVFAGKKSGGNGFEEIYRSAHDDEGKHERGQRMRHDFFQAPVVAMKHALKNRFAGAIELAMFLMSYRTQEAAGEHRRQRQRHKSGNQNGNADGYGKLVQQASDQSAHEEDGNEDRRQRD